MSQPVVANSLYKDIYSFVGRRVSNSEDVADLVQDIFLKLKENEDKLKDKDSIVPWLYRVSRNQIIDFYRKKKSPPPDMSETLYDSDDEVFKEVASWLEFFISNLSKADQEILNLTEVQGQTQREAAKTLNLSLDAAKARHQRAKKRLKESLEKCCRYSLDVNGKIIDFEPQIQDDCCD